MKIHEYNEMMAYLTRPAAPTRQPVVQGGVIGKGGMFQGKDMGHRTGYSTLVAKGIEFAPKIPSYIQKVKNIYGKAKNIFNTFRNKDNLFINDKPLIRKKLNEQLGDDLGFGINVDNVNSQGDIGFSLKLTGEEVKVSRNLSELTAERDLFLQNKIKPLYEEGYVSADEFLELFKNKNISYETSKKELGKHMMSRFASEYGIKSLKPNVPGTTGSKWYKDYLYF